MFFKNMVKTSGMKRKKENEEKTESIVKKNEEDSIPSIFAQRTFKELVAPNGVNPNNSDYMVLNDNGVNIYIRNFYIDKLPRRTTFANTFAKLFNFSNSTCSVYVKPLLDGKANKDLDKQIISLESELCLAEDNRDTNRIRKVGHKMREAEAWAAKIDSGENSLFMVGFIFTVYAQSLEELDIKSGDLKTLANEKSIEISATYGCHPEAFKLNTPTNNHNDKLIKYHPMDKFSLSTIFNHTRSEFYHKNGIILARNYLTGKPITFDIYDPSHDGFGLVITGTTGSGKSTTVKIMVSRNEPFGYRYVSLDTQARGNRGEYSLVADRLNGVNYQIHAGSKNIINPFEIDVQLEYDEVTDTEYKVLKLANKITDVKYILLTIIKNDDNIKDTTFIKSIVSDNIKELYAKAGIIDGDIESLYETGSKYINGNLTTGKVKKRLPTISDFYILTLKKKYMNTNINYDLAYDTILATLKEYVREITICEECGYVPSSTEISNITSEYECPVCGKKHTVVKIVGTKPYYDGQSTIEIDENTSFSNIDISQLHEKDQPVAQQISLNFIQENFIKKNSMNIKKAKKMVVIFDETHRMFPFEDARKFIVDVYRTARKYNVSPWTITQRLVDYTLYPECEAIITNSAAKFIMKQDTNDNEKIAKMANLTESQILRINSLGKGEICIKDGGKTVFCKVDMLDIEKMIVETDVKNIQKMHEDREKEIA